MAAIKLYTIGFTKKPAEKFFGLIRGAGVTRLIDIRLNPGGQLAGFAKQADLAFFLRELANCDYHHEASLAPSEAILSEYRTSHDWQQYARSFEALMDRRNVPATLDRRVFEERLCCLLCSEAVPDKCHRRLVAERIARFWPGTSIVHLA